MDANGVLERMADTLDLVLGETRAINRRLDRLERGQFFELKMERQLMATLQDVQDAVTAEDTVIDSAVALIQGLAAQVAGLQPNQQAIDALAADIKGKSDALAAAVAANTPAAPPPNGPTS